MLPSQPYVLFIISDIFCRCTCPPLARARIGTLTIFLLCVALLSGCYFACVSSSYHPVSGLRRCCHCTGAQSHENGIFRGRKKSSIVWTTLPSQPYVFFIISDIFCRCTCPPRARALVPWQALCCTPIWLLFCLRVILLPSRIWFA